ncbi:hypothetical protein D3C71_2201280 [compost metagenome]
MLHMKGMEPDCLDNFILAFALGSQLRRLQHHQTEAHGGAFGIDNLKLHIRIILQNFILRQDGGLVGSG